MSNRVWNIPIEGWSMEQLHREVEQRTTQNAWPFWIVTANPEILLYARSHEDYASVLRQADVRTVDGFGLKLMMRITGSSVSRVTGVELAEEFLKTAQAKKWRVALIGGYKNAADLAKVHLEQRFSGITLMSEAGGNVSLTGEDDLAGEEARHRLTLFSPDVLLVCFGHPKQEQWISRYLVDFPSVKIVAGVGGAVDFWAKTIRRAPMWMRRIGLEWVWRLIQEPKRFLRIIRAVVIFPVCFLLDRLNPRQ